VVLDFLQLVSGEPGEQIRERIQQAAYAARAAARDKDAAVLLVSGTARASYGTLQGDGEKPVWKGRAGDLVGLGKESGEVEYAADTVLALVSKPWPDGKPPPEGTHVHLAVAKQRAGTSGWAELRFDGGRFTEPRRGSAKLP